MSDECCGGNSEGRNVLVYACSGGANVAEIADRACRDLTDRGEATMFCLVGIAAGLAPMLQTARHADLNVVVDGCGLDCARYVFEQAGIENAAYMRVTDLGIEKSQQVRATDAQVAYIADRIRRIVSEDA